MDSLRSFVDSNASLLLPAVRTAMGLFGSSGVVIGIWATLYPNHFADTFRCPIPTPTPTKKRGTTTTATSTTTSTNTLMTTTANLTAEERLVYPWIIAFAGRDVLLGLGALALLYMDEVRALSVLSIAVYLAPIADATAATRFGKPGAWKAHPFPSIFFVWVGPVGLLLTSGKK